MQTYKRQTIVDILRITGIDLAEETANQASLAIRYEAAAAAVARPSKCQHAECIRSID